MNMYELAVNSQSAYNLSGLCHSMGKLADEVWEEIRKENNGNHNTKQFNTHPVMRLLAEQIMFLTSGRDWSKAMRICEEKSAAGK